MALGETKFKVIDDLSQMAELGVSAATVLKSIEPLFDRRLGNLLDRLQSCPPELGPMLDIRAQISEIWRIRKELRSFKDKGENAVTALNNIVGSIETRNHPNGKVS